MLVVCFDDAYTVRFNSFSEIQNYVHTPRFFCLDAPVVTSIKYIADCDHDRSDSLSRAWAYRVWERHFNGRRCFDLPRLIQVCLDLECKSEGTFIDKRGRLCGYMG